MKYTQIPSDTFQKLMMNAGVLVDDFTPATGVIGNIIGATSGGITFNATPEFTDFGEDIDNAPKNTMELKKQTDITVTASGTFVTVDASMVQLLAGAADTSIVSGTTDVSKITPRKDLATTDFKDLWLVGDYSDKNGDTNGGFVAIHMMNVLSTGGFAVTTSDGAKDTFGFTFTGHYSIDAPDTVPYEVFVKAGGAEVVGATGVTGA